METICLIINGPRNGETLNLENIEDESIVNVVHFPPFSRNLCEDDLPMRYSCPRFTKRFHVIGEFVFYLGEEIYIDPIIEEAEQVLGPIAKKI